MSELFDRIVARDADWKREIINTETWPLADRRWLIGRVRELEAALRKYGGHARDCAYTMGHYKGPTRDCDCNWINAFPAAMGATAQETKGEGQ